MSNGFLPLLILLGIFWAFSSASRGKSKGKKPGGVNRPAAGAKPAAPVRPSSLMDSRFAKEFPHLFTGLSEMLEAPAAAPQPAPPRQGSLPAPEPEGTDPCHDDYASLPSGSLSAETEEGIDPCHDGWAPTPEAPSEAEEAHAPGGPGLSWSGNELVRGFIYSEILKRKIG